MKLQQRGLSVPNSDSVKPDKPFIPDKYNNSMDLKKLKRINDFTKAPLELRGRGFSEDKVSSYENITAAV